MPGNWADDDRWTEPAEPDDQPILGVSCGERVREDDTYRLTFLDSGEVVDTDEGERVAFDAIFEGADGFTAQASGDNELEAGDPVRFMTGSARFLSELAEHQPVADKTVEVTVEGIGFDSEYAIEDVTDD